MKTKWHKLPSTRNCEYEHCCHKQRVCSSHTQFDTTKHRFQFHIQNSNSIAYQSHSPNLKRIHINKSIRSFICLNVSRLVIVYRFAEIHNHLLHIQDIPWIFFTIWCIVTFPFTVTNVYKRSTKRVRLFSIYCCIFRFNFCFQKFTFSIFFLCTNFPIYSSLHSVAFVSVYLCYEVLETCAQYLSTCGKIQII